MKKIVIGICALACAAALCSQPGAQAQKTFTVTGAVAVENLPLDAEGNLRVAGGLTLAPAAVHYVGLTQATFVVTTPILTLSRACSAELPGTLLCEQQELLKSIPPPAQWSTPAALVMFTDSIQVDGRLTSSCMGVEGGLAECASTGPLPLACCG